MVNKIIALKVQFALTYMPVFNKIFKAATTFAVRNNNTLQDMVICMAQYKYLLWDIDGTVLDFNAAEKAAIKTLFAEFGFGECSDEMISEYSAINVKYWQAMERGEITKPQVLIGRFREFFKLKGLPLEFAEKFNSRYQVTLGDTIVFLDDSYNILCRLKDKYTLAAITNGTKDAQTKKLSRSSLDQVFDYIFISEDLGVEKPGKAFFDTALSTMNIQDRTEVLIIGDSLTSDIRGGVVSGIDTCWYNPRHAQNTSGEPVTYEISDLHEINDILNWK